MHGHFLTARGLLPALACLLLGAAPPRDGALDQARTSLAQGGLELTWSDAEERLQGSLRPGQPHAGQELTVTLHVGSFDGPTFEGPVRVGLRAPGAAATDVHLVLPKDRSWRTTFRLPESGTYTLDVAFRTTHEKIVHATFEVADAPIPLYVAWGLLGLAALGALAYGVKRVRPGATPTEPAPPP